MTNILNGFFDLLNSTQFLCLTKTLTIIVKVLLIAVLTVGSRLHARQLNRSSLSFICITSLMLICSLLADCYVFINALSSLYYTTFWGHLWRTSHFLRFFLTRAMWAANITFHLSTSILVEKLTRDRIKGPKWYTLTRTVLGAFLIPFYLVMPLSNPTSLSAIEVVSHKIVYFYIMVIGLHTIWQVARAVFWPSNLPRLLKHQLAIFVLLLLAPHLLVKLATVNPLTFSASHVISNLAFMNISNIILTYAMYFCTRKLVGLRFLNVKQHVDIPHNFEFVKGFKETLEKLANVNGTGELKHVTQEFFRKAFNLSSHDVHLHVRDRRDKGALSSSQQHTIKQFLSSADTIVSQFAAHHKILIKDEIEFSYFYNELPDYGQTLQFLTALEADIFIPIYDENTISSYIIIDENARPKQFYNGNERDEMLLFATYLSSIVNLLHHRNLKTLLAHEKELQDELYNKHQEINQYKESIRSFLQHAHEREIGVIFYKNRKFSMGNKAAEELLACDPNLHQGRPVVQGLTKVAKRALDYNTNQTLTVERDLDTTLVLNALANPDRNTLTILIYYPDITDTLRSQMDVLHDPSQWDYLLYLESTETGRMISHLIPGKSKTLMNFKLDVLKVALSKKATLLQVPEQDIEAMVNLLHTVSTRQTLHTMHLTTQETDDYPIAIKLFGINPILAGPTPHQPLLEQLHDVGTLFIRNVHFLKRETQEYLAECVRYGYFRKFKSEQKNISNVRIICSSDRDLQDLAKQDLFSPNLLHELRKTSLVMPDLTHVSPSEYTTLIEGLAKQIAHTHSHEHLFTLNRRTQQRLLKERPVSIHELKHQITSLVKSTAQQSSGNNTQIEPAHVDDDENLDYAVSLGKKALKNKRIMLFLWKRFQSQTKIATLLGVNRSSVNRRCKEFHIT